MKSSAAVIESTDYAQAMDLYRSREYVQAERAFHAFAVAHPDAPEAEDATFLEASALARTRAALAPWKTTAPEEVAAALATCRE